jgi:stearoyl-CoA desaturase (delta-9 desaturase)
VTDTRENYFNLTSMPMLLLHLTPLAAIWTGTDRWDVALFLITFWVRMFAITGGYHRYFSHRAYKTGRVFQFVLAFVGGTATQKGALWWAANHRWHHRHSDGPEDVHSPLQRGFWYAHIGWIMCSTHERTRSELIGDLWKYPELRFINRFHLLPPLVLALVTWLVGGASGFVWGYCISTVVLWHATFTINSLAHVYGKRRYVTKDTSRNNWALALLTFGEGWHNNHHHYQSATRNGFHWWEIDITYYVLVLLRACGLAWGFRAVPVHVKRDTIHVRHAAMLATARQRWEQALARFEAAQTDARQRAADRYEEARLEAHRKWDVAVARLAEMRGLMDRRWAAAAASFDEAVDEAVATLDALVDPETPASA